MTWGWGILIFLLMVAAYCVGYFRAHALLEKEREADQLDTMRAIEREFRRGK